MKILVTGGAGYIGSHCVRQLIKSGYSVVVMDNLSTGHQEFLGPSEFVKADIRNLEALNDLFSSYEIGAVMHFAGSCYVAESVIDPQFYYINNVLGTLNLLSAMKNAGVRHFIFSSSCSVYGNPESLPVTERETLKPVSPYGRTKYFIEKILEDSARAGDIQYVSFRYFNAAGADPTAEIGEYHNPETHLIPLIFQASESENSPLTIAGGDYPTPDGTCIRDYIHVNDIAQAHILGLKYLQNSNIADGGTSEVFNLGSEKGYSVREVIACCEAVTQRKIPYTIGPRRDGDPVALVASAEKIKGQLGWVPVYQSLTELIETAWQWHLNKSKIMNF
ncbi:MAG: UDP-glucose 4-epimerase GalE [Cyanobacteria bacterium]|nr:UDP-glucose 4-epimerase GalE [Cyanobacteriota bacterium]